MDILKYKDYYGSIEYSKEDGCLCGEVLGLNSGLILYEGNTFDELERDFKEGVDSYLDCCKRHNIDPGKSQFVNVHIPSNVYEKINMLADNAGMSFNTYISKSIANVAVTG